MIAQLDLALSTRPAPTEPDAGTQCAILLTVFRRGDRLTVAQALSVYGVYALSQRCGDLRKLGWPIQSEYRTLASGARVKEYWL